MELIKSLRVVVVFLEDVRGLRDKLRRVIDEDVEPLAKKYKVRIDCRDWRSDVLPGFHLDGPQGVIDEQLRIAECDVLVGIFGTRLGAVRADGKTNIEHEFDQAFEAWKKNQGVPEILLYFPELPLTSEEEAQQSAMLEMFRRRAYDLGFCGLYRDEDDFVSRVRGFLMNKVIQEVAQQTQSNAASPVLAWTASACPAVLRAEGVAERIDDITLTFAGGSRETPVPCAPALNIELILSASITNRLDGVGLTDAVLQILFEESASIAATIRGRVISSSQIVFDNLVLPPVAGNRRCTARIVNVRVNASSVGTSAPIAGTVVVGSVSRAALLQLLSLNNSFIVGETTQACFVSSIAVPEGGRGISMVSAAKGLNPSLLRGMKGASFNRLLVFREGFAGAFKTRCQEASGAQPLQYWGAHGMPGSCGEAELVDCGTRFIARFKSVPPGARLFVSMDNLAATGGRFRPGSACLVSADANGVPSGPHPSPQPSSLSIDGVPVIELPLKHGNSCAVWELMEAELRSNASPEAIRFGVALAAEPNGAQPGTCAVNCGIGPYTTDAKASREASVPRFLDAAVDQPVFSIEP